MQTRQICICLSQAATNTYEVLKMGMPKTTMLAKKLLLPPSVQPIYLLAHSHTRGSLWKLQVNCHTSWNKRLKFCTCAQIEVCAHDDVISWALEVCCGNTYVYLWHGCFDQRVFFSCDNTVTSASLLCLHCLQVWSSQLNKKSLGTKFCPDHTHTSLWEMV